MDEHPLLLFDGVCNLCNRTVQFVIRHDRKGTFRFATLQGEAARKALSVIPPGAGVHLPEGTSPSDPSSGSVILLHRGVVYQRSSAVLKVFQLLGGAWKVLAFFYIVPRPVRDGVYEWIARNRYRWFGRKDECMVPTPELGNRFLDPTNYSH
jgi:predicted DCC family thiol-disulfide oxidoreductase YuxK